jgi:hypothetical protein
MSVRRAILSKRRSPISKKLLSSTLKLSQQNERDVLLSREIATTAAR